MSTRIDPEEVFQPNWPPGISSRTLYRVLCDDKGRNGQAFLDVMISEDGDVHLAMQDWEDYPDGSPSPLPGIRVRTGIGGGRNLRTRQALLWLAKAIQLDTAEREEREERYRTQATQRKTPL